MDLKGLFTPAAIAANWNENPSNQIPYLGETLFAPRKKAGMDLSWIKGSRGLPVSLAPSTFDAKARFRDRIAAQKIVTEMPFFREGFLIKEKDRQELLRAKDSADPYVVSVLDRLFDDGADLINGARVVPERMIWQLLAPTNGKPGISISANGVDYTYDYDPNGTFKASHYTEISTETDKWDAPDTATPIEDLRDAMTNLNGASGAIATTAVMSRKTFNYLVAADSVKSAVLAQNATANVLMTDAVVQQLLFSLLGLRVIVYTKQYKDESGTARFFYPDNMVTLIPDGSLGYTWYGTTPEEADLMNDPAVEVEIVNTGVALTRIVIPHPVNIETYASEIVLPSFERMDEVAVLKVA